MANERAAATVGETRARTTDTTATTAPRLPRAGSLRFKPASRLRTGPRAPEAGHLRSEAASRPSLQQSSGLEAHAGDLSVLGAIQLEVAAGCEPEEGRDDVGGEAGDERVEVTDHGVEVAP